MDSENKIVQFFETLNSIPIPGWIKKNVMTALGKGVGNLIISGLDWPTSWFEAKAREVRAKAEGNESVQKEASAKVAELFKADNDLAKRALNFYAENIIESQINREDVAIKSLDFLPYEISKANSKSEMDIDIDWLKSFWQIAESKSKNEIKLILAKILAKEIVRPNSVSLHTLQVITNLTSDIGQAFHKLCNMSFKDDDFVYVVHPNIGPFMTNGELSEYGITFSNQTEFECMGLIRTMNVTQIQITPTDNADYEEGDYGGIRVKYNFSKGVKIIDFTPAGREIRDFLDLKPNPKYTEYLLGLGEEKFKLE